MMDAVAFVVIVEVFVVVFLLVIAPRIGLATALLLIAANFADSVGHFASLANMLSFQRDDDLTAIAIGAGAASSILGMLWKRALRRRIEARSAAETGSRESTE